MNVVTRLEEYIVKACVVTQLVVSRAIVEGPIQGWPVQAHQIEIFLEHVECVSWHHSVEQRRVRDDLQTVDEDPDWQQRAK